MWNGFDESQIGREKECHYGVGMKRAASEHISREVCCQQVIGI